MKNTKNIIRHSLLTNSVLGFEVIPVDPTEQIWCIRTRQEIPTDVIAQRATEMISMDPQTRAPKGKERPRLRLHGAAEGPTVR